MGREPVLRAVGVLLVGTFMEFAAAGPLDFSDEFGAFDAARWSKGDHQLGRSHLDPGNASVSGGNLRIKLPRRSLEGAEIVSKDLYGYGSFSARIRVPHAPTSITGFFLYCPPDYASEIDVEIHNDSSRRAVIHGVYSGGSQTHVETAQLPFDPTDGFHEYRFDYAPGSVSFYADGRLMRTWTDGIPDASMHLLVNAWYPTWLEGRASNKDRYVLVDRIQHTAP